MYIIYLASIIGLKNNEVAIDLISSTSNHRSEIADKLNEDKESDYDFNSYDKNSTVSEKQGKNAVCSPTSGVQEPTSTCTICTKDTLPLEEMKHCKHAYHKGCLKKHIIDNLIERKHIIKCSKDL